MSNRRNWEVPAVRSSMLHGFEGLISQDSKCRFTIVSYLSIVFIYLNLTWVRLIPLGVFAFILFFLINGDFLANVFFQHDSVFLRWTFGFLLLIMLLGFVGWLVMLAYNLDVPLFLLVLIITATVSSLLNRRRKQKNAAR